MKKCPFTWLEKECTPDCALFMEVIRVFDDTKKEEIVKGCVFVLDHEERRNHTQRLAMMQSELGATKNAATFQGMAMLADSPEVKRELFRLVRKHAPSEFKALMEG